MSNNHRTTLAFIVERFNLTFDIYYGREKTVESLARKKPNTHYLDRAMADLDASTTLYVGDSENDVVAAHRAGLDSVFIRRSHNESVSVSPTFEVDALHGVAVLARGEDVKVLPVSRS